LLVTHGFLEHFNNPSVIISKWVNILKEGGNVISAIPNLFSINSFFLKKFDKETWNQHVFYSPQDLESIHVNAGLKVIQRANFFGKYDVHLLIPWEEIQKIITNKIIFKLIKYFSVFCIEKVLHLIPKKGLRLFNSMIVGVYQKE
jgi:hypothetical protein